MDRSQRREDHEDGRNDQESKDRCCAPSPERERRHRFSDNENPRGRGFLRQHDQATGTAPAEEKRRGGQAGAMSAGKGPGGRKL